MATLSTTCLDNLHLRMANVRKTAGLSQDEFAKMVGTSRSIISQVEIGKIKPSYEVLINTCRLFKVSYRYLLEGATRNHDSETLDTDVPQPNHLQRENELLKEQVAQLQELATTQRDLITELKRNGK